MLDTPHVPFLHARTIGKRLRGHTTEAMAMRWQDTDAGAEITAQRGGEAAGATLKFHFPNVMELAIRARALNPLFARAIARIAAEDRAIIESSSPVEVPPVGEERSVATDAPTLAFRKISFTQIKGTRDD